ncbi:MAG: hypothetical protein Q4A25_00250 [Candidatus Saccharibacteria bacterium]|nr:hypothetical protein [Candidatus Saccharibacteria bacterium]
MRETYIRRFRIFYAARLIITSEAVEYPVRRYEDKKLIISLKRTIFPDDTIVINLKGLDDMRVFEVCLCPLPFKQRDMDQIYLRGHWEDYLTDYLLKKATKKIQNHHKGTAIEDFSKFLYKYGPVDDTDLPTIRTGEVDDARLFDDNNLPRA